MARGDRGFFDEAIPWCYDGTFDFDTNTMQAVLITSATTPTDATANPILGTFTEVTAGGNYTANGINLVTVTVTEAAGVMTVDSTTNPTWAKQAGSPTDAAFALIMGLGTLNSRVNPCCYYLDLGGPIDMVTSDLTITWAAGGIFTVTVT